MNDQVVLKRCTDITAVVTMSNATLIRVMWKTKTNENYPLPPPGPPVPRH